MPKDFQVKNFGFEVKAIDDNTFEGYAAVFRNVDSYRDVIEPGAFTKTIQESKRVKVLWQHDPWQPIGKPIHMEEDNHGLYVKAKISQTERGKEALQLMKDGVIDELSIGYNTIKDDYDQEKNVRLIKEVKLWEFSPVTFAANDQALITDAKSMGLLPALDRLQAFVGSELKTGKELNAHHKTLVNNAIKALTALLEPTDPSVEPPKSTRNLDDEEKKAANEIKAMLQEMQQFANKK